MSKQEFSCTKCGSYNVQVMTWVHPNDIKGEEIYVKHSDQIGYCLDCEFTVIESNQEK
jgi:DNA recombination-dependent growth factor C